MVLDQELEKLGSLVLVQSSAELVDGRRNLQALKQNLLLSLDSDITRPSDISGQIAALKLQITEEINEIYYRLRKMCHI